MANLPLMGKSLRDVHEHLAEGRLVQVPADYSIEPQWKIEPPARRINNG